MTCLYAFAVIVLQIVIQNRLFSCILIMLSLNCHSCIHYNECLIYFQLWKQYVLLKLYENSDVFLYNSHSFVFFLF